MKIFEVITESDLSWEEIHNQTKRFIKLYQTTIGNTAIDQKTVKEMQSIAKLLGRITKLSDRAFGRSTVTVGYILDQIVNAYRAQQHKQGKQSPLKLSTTIRDFANQLALITNGSAERTIGARWTSGRTGTQYSDPSNFIIYPSQDALDDALEFVASKGKQVHYRDSMKTLRTAIQIGRFLIEDATTIRGAFGPNPIHTYRLSIVSTATLRSTTRQIEELSDQQVAFLKDLANTENNLAMQKIQAFIQAMNSEEEAMAAITNSKKLNASIKSKIDKLFDPTGNNT